MRVILSQPEGADYAHPLALLCLKNSVITCFVNFQEKVPSYTFIWNSRVFGIFQDSEGTLASAKINDNSFESPTTKIAWCELRF